MFKDLKRNSNNELTYEGRSESNSRFKIQRTKVKIQNF